MKLKDLEERLASGPIDGPVCNVPNEVYHASSPISRSDIMRAIRSYEHFEARTSPNPNAPALRMGSAFHCLCLEPWKFSKEFAVEPVVNKRTKEGKRQIEEFKEENHGKTILSKDEIEECVKWSRSALSHKIDFLKGNVSINATLKEIRESGDWAPEVSFFGEIDGLKCKCRADLIKNDGKVIIDLKSARDVSSDKWAYSAVDYGLDIQAVHYMALTGASVMLFLCVEKSYPYISKVFYFDDDDLFGVAEVHLEAIKRIKNKERTKEASVVRLPSKAGDIERRMGW